MAKAAEACYLLVELEQQESVVESAIKASGDKVPKVAVAALDILKNAVRSGGRGGQAAGLGLRMCPHGASRHADCRVQ